MDVLQYRNLLFCVYKCLYTEVRQDGNIYITQYTHIIRVKEMDVLTKEEKDRLISKIGYGERIEKEVALSWDGKNLVLRFPKDIADYFNVNKDNRFKKSVKFIVEEKDSEITTKFEVIDRIKPRKKK